MTAPVPDVARRVEEVLAGMTLEEKLAQLVGVWVDAGSGAAVAPLQDAMLDEEPAFEEFARDGIGQITRFYGTAPVDPVSARVRRHGAPSAASAGRRKINSALPGPAWNWFGWPNEL